MGSARETSIAATGTIMGGLDLVVGLLENGDLMGKVAETARLYWTNSALTVNVFSNLFNGTLLVLAGLLFIYVFDLLANSEHGYGFLQKKSYDVAVEEAAYTLGAILELQQQVAELQEHTFGKSREAPAAEEKSSDHYHQYSGGYNS